MENLMELWQPWPGTLKITAFLIGWLVLWYPIALVVGLKLAWQPWQAVTPQQKLPLVLSLYLVSPLPIWAVTWLDQQSLGDYGLNFTSEQLLSLAIAVGVAVFGLGLTLAIQGQIGLLQWHREKWWDLVKLSPLFLILALAIALVEELIFRGIFQNQLQQNLPVWAAGTVISAIFAILHLLWERRLTAYQLPGLWLLGMVLLWARLVDGGNLALAWGLHGGWVFALAVCDATGLITYPDTNGNVWVGKANQPLAGLAGIICLLITSLAIALWPHLSPLWSGF
jgi:membrane protease YdiL (CAAX protease family)